MNTKKVAILLLSTVGLAGCSQYTAVEEPKPQKYSVESVEVKSTVESDESSSVEKEIYVEKEDEQVKTKPKIPTLTLLDDGQKLGMKIKVQNNYIEVKEKVDEIIKNSRHYAIDNIEVDDNISAVYLTDEDTYLKVKSYIEGNETIEIIFDTGVDKIENFNIPNAVEFSIDYTT